MKTHQHIDRRSLALAQVVVAAIDRDSSPAVLSRERGEIYRRFSREHQAA